MARPTHPVTIGELEIEAMSELEAAFLPSDVDQYFAEGLELRPGDVVLDVGANVGAFAVAARQHAGGDVDLYGFEPVPEVHAILERNLARHLGARGRALRFAVGRATGEVELTYYPYMTLLSSVLRGDADHDTEAARLSRTLHTMIAEGRIFGPLRALPSDFLEALVDGHVAQALQRKACVARVVPLSSVLRDHALERVDLLKIDVEGAELDVLDGVDDAQWPGIRQVVLEVERFADRAPEARARLEAHGFTVAAVQDDVQQAGDFGLVFGTRSG